MLQEAEQEFVAKVEAALQANQVDEDQLIEERRKRRQQILAKHQQEQALLQGMPKSDQIAAAVVLCLLMCLVVHHTQTALRDKTWPCMYLMLSCKLKRRLLYNACLMTHCLGAVEVVTIYVCVVVHLFALSADRDVLLCRSCSAEQCHVNFTNSFQADVTQSSTFVSSTILCQ